MTGKPIHILVADDDDDDQFIIKEAISEFSNTQIKISSVYDGLQLLDFLEKRKGFNAESKPDLILLDINMPLMNGIQALTQIKNHKEYKSIPVCMISTLRTEEQQSLCRELGAMDFYCKPNHISAYRDIIGEIFSRTIYTVNA
jgi:CheY-like chemotaxis protein